MSYSYFLNRTLCNVLEEMRSAHKTHNYSSLLGLIEEAQSMANRMEAALGDAKQVTRMQTERHKLKQELKELRTQVTAAGGKLENE